MNASENFHLRVSVVIASLGRAENVGQLLQALSVQSKPPHHVVLSMERPSDCPKLGEFSFEVTSIFRPRGMTAQRNRGLVRLLDSSDIIVFFDDDFVPSKFAIEGIERVFSQNPDIVGATGEVLADGIQGQGISPKDAAIHVSDFDAGRSGSQPFTIRRISSLYGCNMAYRVSTIGNNRFDENLPLYGWLEDVDFSAGLNGPLVWTNAFSGVHCGEKSGREKSGIRLGYSQVVNPIYIVRKGNLSYRKALPQIGGLIAKNAARSFKPEPWIDRKGRLKGNFLGLWDILFGKIDPSRILKL